MKDMLNKLRSKNIEERLKAVENIIELDIKPSEQDMVDALSNHPGFALKKGKTPKDCHQLTKQWLRIEWDASVYRKIDDDPYEDMVILPDIYLDEQEYSLLCGAKAAGDAEFCDNGGYDTLEILKKLFSIDVNNIRECWIQFKENANTKKKNYQYSKYQYANILTIQNENQTKRALVILTNGKIIEIPFSEVEDGSDFIDLSYCAVNV